MLFGLINALAICQELFNQVFKKTLDNFAIIYLDDIFIYSKSKKEHVKHVRHIFQWLKKHSLWVEPKKCFFHKNEVEFLGYQIKIQGIKMEPAKIQRIFDWFTLKTFKEIQRFLKFMNYNWQFIKRYSKILHFLITLAKKNIPFKWG